MKTSTLIVLGIGIAGVAYLLQNNVGNALLPGGNTGTAGGTGAGGTGTQSLDTNKTGFYAPGTGTIFGTGPLGTAGLYRSTA